MSDTFRKLSLKSLLAMEERIDLTLRTFLDQIKDRYARPQRKGNLLRWVQYATRAVHLNNSLKMSIDGAYMIRQLIFSLING